MKIPSQYIGLAASIRLYWKCYGGWWGLFGSPYLFISELIAYGCYPLWHHPGDRYWYDLTLSVLPNLLGFTLGGYAILLAFGNDRFRKLISGADEDGKPSPFLVVNGAFIHFILLQSLAIILALIGIAYSIKSGFFAFIGFWVFLYSLSTAVAAAFAVLNLAEWFDIWASIIEDEDDK